MRFIDDHLITRIEDMAETLRWEWGAEHAYFRDQFNRELADDALDIALALLKTEERLHEHVEKWRRWRMAKKQARDTR